MRTWERDGCGTSTKWIRRVIDDIDIHEIMSVRDINLLQMFMKKLNEDSLKEMYMIDPRKTLYILERCYPEEQAYKIYAQISKVDKIDIVRGELEQKIFTHEYTISQLNEENSKLKDQVLILKAKLFDAFEAGYIPPNKNGE